MWPFSKKAPAKAKVKVTKTYSRDLGEVTVHLHIETIGSGVQIIARTVRGNAAYCAYAYRNYDKSVAEMTALEVAKNWICNQGSGSGNWHLYESGEIAIAGNLVRMEIVGEVRPFVVTFDYEVWE